MGAVIKDQNFDRICAGITTAQSSLLVWVVSLIALATTLTSTPSNVAKYLRINCCANLENMSIAVMSAISKKLIRWIVYTSIVGLAACAGVPSQEMSDARRAFDAAVQADAQQLTPSAIQRASRKLDDANVALRAGKYEQARQLADIARHEAIAARTLSEQLRALQKLITQARTQNQPWQEAQQMMEQAQLASGGGDAKGALALVQRAVNSLR